MYNLFTYVKVIKKEMEEYKKMPENIRQKTQKSDSRVELTF